MNRAELLKCKTVRSLGPDMAESDRLPIALADHSATCLRCQAEVARHRRLKRELGALASESQAAPASVLPAVEEAILLTPQGELANATTKVVATVAGATAAAASVVAVVLWRRGRVVA